MRKTPPIQKPARARDEPGRHLPASDADRLAHGLPLESGEPQPARVPRLH